MTHSGPKWWMGHRQGRRPASRWRHVIGLVLLAVIAVAYSGYRYLTAEARLRHFAEQWLTAFSGGEAHVERVDFALFSGLQLVGVTVAVPSDADFFPPRTSLEDRTLFSAGTLMLRLQPFSIISGELAVPAIIAVNPRLTLVDRSSDGADNWQVVLARRKPGKPGRGGPLRLPELRLRNMEVRQYRLTDRGRAGGAVQTFYAGATPLPDKPQIYDLRVTKLVAGQDEDSWSGEGGRLKIDMEARTVSGSLPAMSLEELLFAAPPEIKQWLDMLSLSGYVRAEQFEFDPKTGARAKLKLRDARLSVPIDDSEMHGAATSRYVQVSKVAGTIRFDGQAAEVNLEGMFRSSPIELKGRLTLPPSSAGGLAGIGLDLDLSATSVQLPRCDEDTPEPEQRFVRRWRRLAAFVHDFDGRGNVDLALKLRKEPGEDKGIEFVEGLLTARGPSAAFEDFPYRLQDLTGEVRFRRDGKVDLVNLIGTHGAGKVIVNGHLGGATSHDTIELSIQGKNIAVDRDLLVHMQPDDRGLCARFLESARVDLDVQLSRPAWAWGGERPNWKSSIDASFLDGVFVYSGFPYRMEHLRGRLRIAEGVLRLDELTGRHGDAVVRASGAATRSADKPADVEVRLQASDLALDDALAKAMPTEVQRIYEQYAPSGRADVRGRLYATSGGPLKYELEARLTDGGLSLPSPASGPAPRLANIEADLHVLPDLLEIRLLKGLLGKSPVTIEGRLGLGGAGSGFNVHLASDSLELGPDVRAALPTALQSDYDSLAVSGRVRLDLTYEEPAATSASAGKEETSLAGRARKEASSVRYTAVVEPLACRMTFVEFPLPLENVTGRVVLTPEGIRIDALAAFHNETRLSLVGRINPSTDAAGVHLSSLQATNLQLDDDLRKAVPWRLRRMWADMQPTGTCDIDLRDVKIGSLDKQERTWEASGRVTFSNMAMRAGPLFTDAYGTLEGRLFNDEQFGIDAKLSLKQARIDGRLIANATARVLRPHGSGVLGIRDVLATFYGGGVLGEVEINYGMHPPAYGISLTARDVSLEDFLDATRKPTEKPLQAKGRIKGTLALTGQFNNPESRQGSGNVSIEDAQMLKLPLILSILQIIHFSIGDNNAFHDALCDFMVDGDEIIFDRIDLRGSAVSMVGAGRVNISDTAMHLVLLIGSPLRLPKVAVLSELVEGIARELMEVHVEGTLETPVFRAEVVRSLRKTIETMTSVRVERSRRSHQRAKE